MNPEHWLDAAEQLLGETRRGAPRQVNLRCAVSMVYYALFHWLANCAADALAGSSGPRSRSWVRLRHEADYDPSAHFSKGDVLEYHGAAGNILETVQTATPAEKRALAIHILFKERPGTS